MANWYGAARTNYVHLADPERAAEICRQCGVEMVERGDRWGFFPNTEDGDFPSTVYVSGAEDIAHCERLGFTRTTDSMALGDEVEFEFSVSQLAECMSPEDVLVRQVIGNEKLRYLTGYSEAWNSRGELIASVSIDDVYDAVRKLGFASVTSAEY